LEQGTLGVSPSDLTQLGLTFMYANYSTLYEGTKTVDPVVDESLEAFITTFQIRHTFGDGLSADISLPIGNLRYEGGEDDDVARTSGLGDIAIGLRYDLWSLWGVGGYSPSVVAHATLGLPTGQFLKTVDIDPTNPGLLTSGSAPPTLLNMGLGAYSATVGLDYTQHVHKIVALRVPLWARIPFDENSNGFKMGNRYGYGLGVMVRPMPGFMVGAAMEGIFGMRSKEHDMGEIEQSGGHWMAASVNVGFRISKRLFASVLGRMPVYTNTNGRQLSETFRVMGSLSVSFGADPSETHDCAHEGPGDHHHHFDEGGEDLGPHDDNEGGHDHHAGDDHEGHDHGAHGPEPTCGTDCKKPCCNKDGAKTGCGADCKNDCCKKDGAKTGCGADCKNDCCKKDGAKTGCGADCKNDCCKKDGAKTGCGTDCKNDCCKKDRAKTGCGADCKNDCCKKDGAKTGCGTDCKNDCCKKDGAKTDCGTDCKNDCCKKNKGDISDAATGGQSFVLKDVLVPGKVTVIDYWAEWCKPCKAITRLLKDMVKKHPNLAVRKAELTDFDCALAKEHLQGVPKIPVVRIYDDKGQLVVNLVGPKPKMVPPEVLRILKEHSTP